MVVVAQHFFQQLVNKVRLVFVSIQERGDHATGAITDMFCRDSVSVIIWRSPFVHYVKECKCHETLSSNFKLSVSGWYSILLLVGDDAGCCRD